MAEERMLNDEILLGLIKANSGGGGGGTNNYNQLENKPQIAGTTLQGNKSLSDLGIASATALGDVSNAVTAITNGQTIDSFADVETALTGKQNALTAGDYISLNNGDISVNRNLVVDNYLYTIGTNDAYYITVTKSQGGEVISTNTYSYSRGTVTNVDGNFTITHDYDPRLGYVWVYTSLKDSAEHTAGYTWTKAVTDTPFSETESFPSEDVSGYKLVIKSEMDSAINAAVSSAYHHAGTKTCAELVAGLLVAANEGNVYNMTDSGTTTSDFIEGQGQPIKAGDNVGIAKISDGVYKFDLLSGFVDTTNFVQKSSTAGLLKNDGTVNDEIEGDVSTLKSGLTTLDNEVNGDATVYPYADVITISDAVPANVADCSVKIEPVQDLHGYDHPWVGGAGKNKWSLSNSYTSTSSGQWVVADLPFALPAGTYTISIADDSTSQNTEFVFKNADGQTLGNPTLVSNGARTRQTFTYSEDIAKVAICMYGDARTICDIQIEEGSTATAFAPYTNICPITGHTEASVTVVDNAENPTVTKTYTIALGDTIYGGTVDFDSGVMTVDRKYYTIGSIDDFNNNGGAVFPSSAWIANETLSDGKTGGLIISDRYNQIEGSPQIGVYISASGKIRINTNGAYESKQDAFDNELKDTQFVYELATPFTVQLTPQQIQLLKGQNTLTASTGQISVTVNGVSGSIGQVQEQVNELATDKQDKTDNTLTTTTKTVVGAINEVNNKMTIQGGATVDFTIWTGSNGDVVLMVGNNALSEKIGIKIAADGTMTRYTEPIT